MRLEPVLAIARYHLRSGIRVGLRSLTMGFVAMVVAVVLHGDPRALLGKLAALLYPAHFSLVSIAILVLACAAVTKVMSPRIRTDLGSWTRHLPATGVEYRRGAVLGMFFVQIPILILFVGVGWSAAMTSPLSTIPRMLGILLLMWSVANTSLSSRIPGVARAAYAAAGIASVVGTWTWLSLGAALVGVLEVNPRGIKPPGIQRTRHWDSRTPTVERLSSIKAAQIWTLISLRALGWNSAGALGAAALAIVPLVFFVRNNELTEWQTALGVRMASLLATVAVMATLADLLARRRPTWEWSRSLPRSAATLVVLDASLLAVSALPGVLVCAIARASALPIVFAAIPFVAVRGATAVRRPITALSSPGISLLGEGFVLSMVVALVPWVTVGLMFALPMAVSLAATAERQVRVGRWDELTYVPMADGTMSGTS